MNEDNSEIEYVNVKIPKDLSSILDDFIKENGFDKETFWTALVSSSILPSYGPSFLDQVRAQVSTQEGCGGDCKGYGLSFRVIPGACPDLATACVQSFPDDIRNTAETIATVDANLKCQGWNCMCDGVIHFKRDYCLPIGGATKYCFKLAIRKVAGRCREESY